MGSWASRGMILRGTAISALLQGAMALAFLVSEALSKGGENCRVHHDCAGSGLTYSLIVWPCLVLAMIGGALTVLLTQRISAPRNLMAACWLGASWLYVMYWTWPFLIFQ